ncbi:hypothetical protein PY64_07900 [Lacticaseibacillus rhamnosus]|uniref:Uncharacterized protein n=1 Tax=Lacticaseibacillus rhamnosus (strain ATCC 53103 / LMG 18243 / GG) TaxID=568703 RepID=A0A809N1A7_LACRG|nr:hypothetical protein N507_0450 [Lacticaseibacillus rhamnosus DSM 14870]OAU55714.1 hypothetical protein PY64_07900 [Lacticaseibacillus rhamnosus]BAI42193.1 hypothetical protein LRHM_1666 [Lacticaseibacillus rhamnosus GG]CAR87625.1 Putative protein without homology [Lacticaseibacillus rhamnosus GG]
MIEIMGFLASFIMNVDRDSRDLDIPIFAFSFDDCLKIQNFLLAIINDFAIYQRKIVSDAVTP